MILFGRQKQHALSGSRPSHRQLDQRPTIFVQCIQTTLWHLNVKQWISFPKIFKQYLQIMCEDFMKTHDKQFINIFQPTVFDRIDHLLLIDNIKLTERYLLKWICFRSYYFLSFRGPLLFLMFVICIFKICLLTIYKVVQENYVT